MRYLLAIILPPVAVLLCGKPALLMLGATKAEALAAAESVRAAQ